jgi:hydroxymethylbilane synthase
MIQAEIVKKRLVQAHHLPEAMVELCPYTTTGDQITNRSLIEIGGKGLFTKEIEEALLDNTIDMAVHSMKDVPADLPPGLEISCFIEREEPWDVWISRHGHTLYDLPHGSPVGSSSLRRGIQVLARRPDLKIVPIRGNVQTRLQKLMKGEAEATILALAGLKRLNFMPPHSTVLSKEEMLPAVAQGVLGVEIRSDDAKMRALLDPLNHPGTALCVSVERTFLQRLHGSCRTPIAAFAEFSPGNTSIHFTVVIGTRDASEVYRFEKTFLPDEARDKARALADECMHLHPHIFTHQ